MIAGLDLSALESRVSGIAIGSGRVVKLVKEANTDEEILSEILSANVSICAIDAPLTLDEDREADKLLRRYGGMSIKISGIRKLAERALRIRKRLEEENVRVIEVFPTATAKVLGIYRKNKVEMLPYLKSLLEIQNLEKVSFHTVDALLAYYTAYLFVRGEYYLLGGEIVLPSFSLSR